MTRQIGPNPAEDLPEDPGAGLRAKPFRLVQVVCVVDAMAGMFVHYRSSQWGVPGEVLGQPILEFVGLALIAIGVSGYALFEVLARLAMRRADPPRTLR